MQRTAQEPSSMDELITSLSTHFGIAKQFTDLAGVVHPTTTETQLALLRANGVDVDNKGVLRELNDDLRRQLAHRVLPHDLIIPSEKPFHRSLKHSVNWHLSAADVPGFTLEGRATDALIFPALEPGIYALTLTTKTYQESVTVLATPAYCPAVNDVSSCERVWGVNAALYALRSERNLGLGDYADLAALCRHIGETGASFVGLNPVHALGSNVPQIISPYSPSHRGLLESGYIALDRIPGLIGHSGAESVYQQVLNASRSKSTDSMIDYSLQRRSLSDGLTQLYALFSSAAPAATVQMFREFKKHGSQSLQDFVLYEAISQRHGADWRQWPVDLRNRDARALKNYRDENSDEIDFQYWLQWVANVQLQQTSESARTNGLSLGLYLDFAVGARRSGAESWCEMESCALGVSIGAPPDQLSPAGQNWQLSGFSPHKLRANRYRPYQMMLRSVMQHAKMLRIDHVLGLNRIFWIPDDGSAGGYIQQPFESLLAVIKIEAQRAGTVVIGEDLGLVPKGFRETMRGAGFYGYSVLQYEKDKTGKFNDPAINTRQTLACFGTHDTPTLEGYVEGRDILWWRRLDWIDESTKEQLLRQRARDIKALLALAPGQTIPGQPTVDNDDLGEVFHRMLAGSNSALVTVQLDDILGLKEAQNLPGTTDEHPNWRRRYPFAVEALGTDEKLRTTEHIMQIRSNKISR